MRSGFRWIARSIPAYSNALVLFHSRTLAVFVAVGIVLSLRPLLSRRPLPPIHSAMLAGILAIYGFHVIFPHPIDGRYMFAAVPLGFFFFPASLPERARSRAWATAAWALAVVTIYAAVDFSLARAVPAGFYEALAIHSPAAGW